MNGDLELKLQAYLDDELSGREARRVADWLAGDPEAQALLNELRLTHSILAGNEPEAKLADGREFYWSKIERAIAVAEPVPRDQSPAEGFLAGWQRLVAPLAGIALAVFLVLGMIKFFSGGAGETAHSDSYPMHLAEIETPSDETGAYSFRSQSENMFVVWVYDRTPDAAPAPEPELIDDMVTQ